ncbi:uncharacterized protein PAC_00041 [Phialocephala subalpina]|uniref:Uncharacterized protein n=1 Tax=Phialocephala subalpina TaxID=576137 RepID=A0A1L7WBY1_9HELO|nr:uncharacterized protein PAC_00041 [Phialocephala subalpina]
MKQTVVDFWIDNRCFCYKYNDYFEGGTREYLAKFIDRRAPDLSIDPLHGFTPLEGVDSMAIEDRLQVEKRYADLKRAYQFDSSRHPERIFQHEIMARAYKEDPNTSALEEMNVDFLMLELVRHLSNVSTTMRQDLGSVLFAKTALHISENALTTSGPISCLMSRPAIHKGIKFLKLSFSCTSCDTYPAGFDQFKVACQYLSNILELTHLSIYIDVGNIVLDSERKEMEDLCRGAGRYSGLDIIRSIQVTKQFQIYFVDRRYYVLWEDPWKDSDEERYQGLIEDFLRPNTLRNSTFHSTQVITDEKTKYFQSRKE